MSRPTLNLQDNFLNQVRRENLDIVLILLDGSQLVGRVKGFDNFTVIVSGSAGGEHLVYKHAIAQLVSNKPIVSTVAMQRPPRHGGGDHGGGPRREGGGGGPRQGGGGGGGGQHQRGPGGAPGGGGGETASAASGDEGGAAAAEPDPAHQGGGAERPPQEPRGGGEGGGGGPQKPKGRQGEGFNKLDLSALRDKV